MLDFAVAERVDPPRGRPRKPETSEIDAWVCAGMRPAAAAPLMGKANRGARTMAPPNEISCCVGSIGGPSAMCQNDFSFMADDTRKNLGN
jgi:hypothetical protein